MPATLNHYNHAYAGFIGLVLRNGKEVVFCAGTPEATNAYNDGGIAGQTCTLRKDGTYRVLGEQVRLWLG
jgi:hypothetical protein